MTTATRLGGFLAVLAAVFALALGVGNAVGPVRSGTDEHRSDHAAPAPGGGGSHGAGGHEHATPGDGGQTGGPPADDLPGGLVVSQQGYTLDLDEADLRSGQDVPVTFHVRDADGRPVLDYEETHDEELHFIAVRRDLTGYQHVHPTLTGEGRWRTSLDLTPGSWRLFADFRPAAHGETMTLGGDASVAGRFEPEPLPGPSRTAVVDDYTVTLDGDLVPGASSELVLSVSRDGRPVTDLQPYLAAYGHLVALRAGDLGYLHVHPDGAPGNGRTPPGPGITFFAEVPSEGDYRLYLDFKHRGVVRTAEFTARADAGAVPPSTPQEEHSDGGSGHTH